MKRFIALSLLLLPLLPAQNHQGKDNDWKFEDKETLRKSFKVSAAENASKLLVDQMNGWIHVTGGTGSEIQVVVEKEIRASTQAELDDANKAVKYDMTQDGNNVKLYEDGPYRHRDTQDRDRHYSVRYNCEVQVPAGVSLDLHTMNGAIDARNTTGEFKVHTMNGGIKLAGMGATGSAETMNGPVDVGFTRNPTKDATFKTMNGSIDIRFPSSPDAELQLKTMHGEVFADFDVTSQPTVIKAGTTTGDRHMYRSGGDLKVRAGKGGPQLSMETMNGAIRLHSKAN